MGLSGSKTSIWGHQQVQINHLCFNFIYQKCLASLRSVSSLQNIQTFQLDITITIDNRVSWLAFRGQFQGASNVDKLARFSSSTFPSIACQS